MSRIEIRQFEDAGAIVEGASDDLVRGIAESIEGGIASFSIALSGGRVAGSFCRATGQKLRAGRVPTGGLHFFWADERCVPPMDPDSNFGVANEALFEPLGIPENQIHRIRGENPPAAAAADAARELTGIVGRGAGDFPALDFVFLGMGEDGHVASLFPGEVAETKELIYKPVRATKPPPERITLTYGMLIAAKEVWVLIPGAAKKGALTKSMGGTTTPLGRVLAARVKTVIYTDIRSI